jgi:hypothetical protein
MSDVVVLNLDRPRELRFGHKALKTLKSLTGMTLLDIEKQLTEGNLDPDVLEKMVYAGLQQDARNNGESLTLEQVADLLDEIPAYIDIITAVAQAFVKSFAGDNAGNAGEPEVPAGKDENTISTKV